jgi:hypothetical protein
MGLLQSKAIEDPVVVSVEAQQLWVAQIPPSEVPPPSPPPPQQQPPQQEPPQPHHRPIQPQQRPVHPQPSRKSVVARREASLDSLVGRFARVAARIESILVHDDCFEFSKNVKHAVDAGIVPKSLVGRLWDFRHLRNDVVHQPENFTHVELQLACETAETWFTELKILLEAHHNEKVAPPKMSLKHSR